MRVADYSFERGDIVCLLDGLDLSPRQIQIFIRMALNAETGAEWTAHDLAGTDVEPRLKRESIEYGILRTQLVRRLSELPDELSDRTVERDV